VAQHLRQESASLLGELGHRLAPKRCPFAVMGQAYVLEGDGGYKTS
jgi:hypothetical protein